MNDIERKVNQMASMINTMAGNLLKLSEVIQTLNNQQEDLTQRIKLLERLNKLMNNSKEEVTK